MTGGALDGLTGVTGLARAALPSVPGLNLLPGVRKTDPQVVTRRREGVTADERRLAAYEEVCGFPRKDSLPVTYPHLLAFGLHLAIMADPAYPFPAIGSVHLENTIVGHRPIGRGERLDVEVGTGAVRPHAKGSVVDFETRVHAGDELVWEEVSTYLRRGRGTADAAPGLRFGEAPERGGMVWRLPADLGRRYARVSGDHNPIHLYPVTAKALGFPRQIAHGMWSKSRSVAAVENRLPDAVRVEVAWKKPILLPSRVRFVTGDDLGQDVDPAADPAADRDDRVDLALTSPDGAVPHLLGRITPA